MKKSMLLVIGIVLLLVIALVACDAAIDGGKVDVPDEVLDKLPFTVEVSGLEGVSGTGKADLLADDAYATALATVKRAYYVADDATVYAADIKIVDADGKEITVGKPVTVTLTMKDNSSFVHNAEVFHVHDGKADQLAIAVDGNKITFTVETFSPFVLVPKHEHAYGAWRTYSEATCGDPKMEIRECVCGAIETRTVGEPLGHLDADGNNVCDRCGAGISGGSDVCAHTPVHVEAVAVTCTTDGNVEYWQCEKCGKYFSDAACTNEITLNATMLLHMGHFDADEDGKCDKCGANMGKPQIKTPKSVDVVGANGSVLTADVQEMSAEDAAAALATVHSKYDFDETATTYAVDISIQNAQPGDVARVSVKLQDPALSLDSYAVYHVHGEDVEMIIPEVSGDSLVFTVGSFSPFIIGPKHLHQPSTLIVLTPATCTKDGEGYIECVKCHEKLETQVIKAAGHVDKNEDGKCDVCDANLAETPIEGKVFKFDHAEGEDVNNATYATAYADATFSFFADNYMEYHEFYAVAGNMLRENNTVLCGTYALAESEGGYAITLTVTKRYYDDEETMIPIPTYTYVYDVNAAAVLVRSVDYMGREVTLYFTADPEAEPVKYTQPTLADNWDDAVIIAAFNAVGATKDYTFPKLDNVLSMTKSEVDNGQVTVTIKMASKMQGGTAAKAYKSLLESQYYSYQFDTETRANTDDNLFWFHVATDYADGYPVLIVKISRFYPDYPSAGIVNFLTDIGITDEIPLFMTQWAMKYRFDTDDDAMIGNIHIVLRYAEDVERHDTEVAAAFRATLLSTDYNYYEKTVKGKTYLCSENKQLALRFVMGGGDSIDVCINNFNVIYPAEEIAAYLTGTEDTFIDLDDDSVSAYTLYTNEADNPTALRLVGTMPATADARLFISGLETAYADAGYKWGGFATHFGNDADETLSHLAWISPNNEIAIMFAAFNAGEHSFGNIAYYSVSIVNLTAIPDNNKALMTALSAAGHSTAVERGATYTFTGGIAYLYTIVGTTDNTVGSMYTYDLGTVNVGTIDTSTPGERTLRISLKGNDEIYVDVPITVLGLTGITVTGTPPKIDGRVAYYSAQWKLQQDYTITKYYSDGHTASVKGNAEGFTFSDIDGSLAKQDLTISCTEDGVTVNTTVAIGLFKSFNFTCTNTAEIGDANAVFAIFAQGGEYGELGAWLTVNYDSRRKTFGGQTYFNADGFYIVRLSPDLDVFGSLFYDLETNGVWNVSDYFELAAVGQGMQEFAFSDLD